MSVCRRKNLPCAHFFLYQTSCPVNKIYINWGIWNEDHTFSPSGMKVSKLFYNYSVILLLMSIETDALHSILCQQCLIYISQPYKVDCSDIPLKFLAMKKESSFNQPRSCIVLKLRPHQTEQKSLLCDSNRSFFVPPIVATK